MSKQQQHAPQHSGHPTGAEPARPSEMTLEKEFELERMILFTDAVFAIAITLLVIDIKWPDLREVQIGIDQLHLFKPTIFGFFAFATSFLYIGRSWSVHLRLFRLVKKYDQGLINRNLFFLFFIVVFPFTNSGLTEHNSEVFVLPVILYLINLAFLGYAHFRLCRYILIEKPSLSVDGRKAEKNFVYTRGRYMMFVTATGPVAAVGLWLLFPQNPSYVLFSFVFVILGLRVIKRRLRTILSKDAEDDI